MDILTPIKFNNFALFREVKISCLVALSLEDVATFLLGRWQAFPTHVVIFSGDCLHVVLQQTYVLK